MNEGQDQWTDVQGPPTPVGIQSWSLHWQAQGMPWRNEPEINTERQRFLAERLAVVPDTEQGVYPFHDENGGIKLTRADVEWLLATHENKGVRGPVDWNDEQGRGRAGLDLRGADLRLADLSNLPLARTHGALSFREAPLASRRMRHMAALHLENANMVGVHLEGSDLSRAHFDGADLRWAHLECTDLNASRFAGANLSEANIQGADMRRVLFDEGTYLTGLAVSGGEFGAARLVDVRYGGVNLATVRWPPDARLGDEVLARTRKSADGKDKGKETRASELEAAVRSTRQLAIALHAQGLNETSDRFAYRSQGLQRWLLRRQRNWLRYFGSLLLNVASGYGYKPMRSLVTYILVICLFSAAYLLNAQFATPHLTWDEALVLSISSFHGRGFFTSGISLSDTIARLAAGEAIIGLLIEIVFIATFTQRFFAR